MSSSEDEYEVCVTEGEIVNQKQQNIQSNTPADNFKSNEINEKKNRGQQQ